MKRGVLCLAMAMAMAMAAPAWSQLPETETRTGSRLPVKIDKTELEIARVRRVEQDFAACVVKNHYKEAVAYLLEHPSVPDTDREGKRLVGRIADPNCLVEAAKVGDQSVMMTMPADTMRYALADTLIRREFATAPLSGLDSVAPLPHPVLDPAEYQPKPGKNPNPKQLEKLETERNKELARIYLSEFGECVVRLDPAKAYALLMTDVTTPQEDAAFRALSPRLGECIVQGQTLTFGKAVVRGTIAYNYFRLAKAPRTVKAAR